MRHETFSFILSLPAQSLEMRWEEVSAKSVAMSEQFQVEQPEETEIRG